MRIFVKCYLNLKKYFDNKDINFITFNYSYLPKLHYMLVQKKQCSCKLCIRAIQTDLDAKHEIKTIGYKYRHLFKYLRIF